MSQTYDPNWRQNEAQRQVDAQLVGLGMVKGVDGVWRSQADILNDRVRASQISAPVTPDVSGLLSPGGMISSPVMVPNAVAPVLATVYDDSGPMKDFEYGNTEDSGRKESVAGEDGRSNGSEARRVIHISQKSEWDFIRTQGGRLKEKRQAKARKKKVRR